MFLCLLLLSVVGGGFGVQLIARFSTHGVHGVARFTQTSSRVDVESELSWTSEEPQPEQISWAVHQFPVDYRLLDDRCSSARIGSSVVSLDDVFGPVSLNGSTTAGNTTDVLSLIGPKGVWGKSVVIDLNNGLRICSTLMPDARTSVRVAEARFNGPVGGSVYFLWLGSSGDTDSAIYTDLYHTQRLARSSTHKWKIFTTDVLESEADKSRRDCNALQVLYETHDKGGSGDLDARLGLIDIGVKRADNTPGKKHLYHSVDLSLLDLRNKQRQLYLVIFDSHHTESYLACARVTALEPTIVKALIQSRGLKGVVSLQQASPFSSTQVVVRWETKPQQTVLGGFRIHELPPLPDTGRSLQRPYCTNVGHVYNPSDKPTAASAPLPGESSQDSYAVGDLSGKVGYDNKHRWDVYLPLFGRNSVAHRSLVVYRNNDTSGVEEPWVCSTFILFTRYNTKVPMATAEAIFRYPLAGRVVIRQPRSHWSSDTVVIVEQLVHADGTTRSNTRDHRWGVSVEPPGKDFYDWQNRCLSAGPSYDGFLVYFENKTAECLPDSPSGFCRIGSLSERLSLMSIAGRKNESHSVSRRLWTDTLLPLTGSYSIIGRSFVIYDDNGPKARGERLACSKITNVFRRKGVVRDWFGNGQETSVSGKIEFYQQTEYEPTDVEFSVGGLVDAGVYHIHRMPVSEHLDFPCEQSTLGVMFDPYKVGEQPVPPSTLDQYAVGDLSGKYGRLDSLSHLDSTVNDSSLMLFGQRSVLGRSVVIFKQDSSRWTCATIERGYAPSEARELRAIASFHHPNGYAWGYIRMTQLIHFDGSASDTVIEVNLKHPGENDRNFTQNHNWAIYVNPVGVDATVQVLHTRCTAAGYMWNPYYTQLADPLNHDLYKEECGPDHPLRCYVGDLSGRLGPIDIGGRKRVFSDPNFPLEGTVSAMGKSIVILDKNRGPDKFACANIEPDKDTIKYVNVRRTPKFNVAQFLQDVRRVMGVPEWLLTVDTRRTTILHGGACTQLLIHFKGPEANKLEQDFSRLLSTGRLDSPSLNIPGYLFPANRKTRLSYKLCGADNEKEGAKILYGGGGFGSRFNGASNTIPSVFSLIVTIIINITR